MANLALQGSKLRLVLGNGAGSGLFSVKLAVVVLVQPQLNEICRNAIRLLWPSPELTDSFDRYDVTIGGSNDKGTKVFFGGVQAVSHQG